MGCRREGVGSERHGDVRIATALFSLSGTALSLFKDAAYNSHKLMRDQLFFWILLQDNHQRCQIYLNYYLVKRNYLYRSRTLGVFFGTTLLSSKLKKLQAGCRTNKKQLNIEQL